MQRQEKPPTLVGLFVTQGLFGAALGLAMVGCLLAFNVGDLGRLILSSSEPLLAIALLCGGFVITVSSAVIATAVMLAGGRHDDDDDDHDDRRRAPQEGTSGRVLVPIAVRSRRR